jgi:hypothetical protein
MDWGLLGVILAPLFFISTVVLSVFIAIRFYKRKGPVWAYETTKIIGLGSNAPEELKLTFNDRAVDSVYRTTLIFFNKGSETIRADDVKKKIMINFGLSRILREPIIVKASRHEIEFRARKVASGPNESIELDFSFLDNNDGAVIEVLHTAKQDIGCSGTIIGAKEISYKGKFIPFRALHLRFVFVILFMLFAGVLAAALSRVYGYSGTIAYAMIGAILWVLADSGANWLRHRQFPKWTSSFDE